MRRIPFLGHVPFACLLLLALAVPAVAEDTPATKDKPKAIAFADVAATWPAPAKEHAYRVELVAVLGESPMGTYLVEYGPDMVEGKVAGWHLRERLALQLGTERVGEASYHATADLTPVRGTSHEDFDGRPETETWSTADGVLTLEHTGKDGKKVSKTVEVKPYMTQGRGAVFMAARFLPAKAATYRGTDFSGTNQDEPTAPFTIVVDPEARHEGRKVLSVHGTRGTKHVRLLLEPESREIVRGRMWDDANPAELVLVPQAAAPAKDDLFARAPKNAQEASAHVLYAVTVKERALVEKAFRWTTMYEVTKKQLEAAGQAVPSLEDWKKQTIDQIVGGPKNEQSTPAQVRASLQMFVSKTTVQDTPEGWKAVIWPKNFAHLLVVMEKKDDGWKAVGVRRLS